MITSDVVVNYIKKLEEDLNKEKDAINKLDSAYGDGDLGSNMYLGIKKTNEELANTKTNDIGAILELIGNGIAEFAPSTFGTLVGNSLVLASENFKGHNELNLNELYILFNELLDNIMSIGGAKYGEKTIIDSLYPAVQSLKQSMENGFSLIAAIDDAVNSAEEGMQNTKNIIGEHGRAKWFGEKTIGQIDAGAYLFTVALNCLSGVIKEE